MKKIAVFLSLLFLVFTSSACGDKEKPAILFNQNKITVENVMNYSSVFQPNQRIYYLVLLPKRVKTQRIEIQVIKKDNKEEKYGYQLYWSKSAVLKTDQMYYYDDYVVISQPGAYVMQIYSKDNPTKSLCTALFWVRN